MDVDNERYTYTDKNGKKHQVPIQRVSSLSQLQKGDHMALPRPLYWHHALVEDIDTEKGAINVIEYSNTFKEFFQDNCSPPKNPGKAKVKRSEYKLENEDAYVINHRGSVDAFIAISRARSRLGERRYDVFLNNCEHFVLWCKTGISASEQVNKLLENAVPTKQEILKGLGMAAIGLATKIAPEKIVMTSVREVTKEVVTQTVSTVGQEIVTTGIGVAAKQVCTKTISKGGQEIMKTSVGVATKQVVTQTASKGGREIVKTGVGVATKQLTAQTASKGGQAIMKSSVRVATKQLTAQTVTTGGKEIVKTGTRVTFVSQTASAGKEIVTKGTRVTTREVVTQTSTKTGAEVGESLVGGLAIAAVFEAGLALYDIHRAHQDMEAGRMNQKDFDKTVKKRVGSGIRKVAWTGIGQVLIPVPILGGIVGGAVGGFVEWYRGDTA